MSNNGELEELKKRLYKKGEEFPERKRKELEPASTNNKPPYYWESSSENSLKKTTTMRNLFLFLVVILLALTGFIFYFLFSGTNIVSSKNVDMEVRAPVYAEGGVATKVNIFIENNNTSDMESSELLVNFPDNTFTVDGFSTNRQRFSLGKIKAGGTTNQLIELVFVGAEKEEKKIEASLEYRFAESSAVFEKKAVYTLKISRPAMGVSIVAPKEISAKKEFEIKIETVSNMTIPAQKLSLKMSYPPGFQFVSASPSPSDGTTIWSLGDNAPLQKRNIVIKGFLEGLDLDEKSFVATVGVLDNDKKLLAYGDTEEVIVLKKPSLNLSVFINGQEGDTVILPAGGQARFNLRWVNNLPYPVRDIEVSAEIAGITYDEKSVSVSNGFYRVADRRLIWNSSTLPLLRSLGPGENSSTQFSFSVKKELAMSGLADKNFAIGVKINIKGYGTTEESENREIVNIVSRTLKIASPLQVVARVLHYSEELKNEGPMPPKVGQETTYTIVWSLGNNINDFSGVKISGYLPPYVRWTNVFSPTDADIVFDDKESVVTWNAGDISAGTGVFSSAKKVIFQVAFAPSYNQIGMIPNLLEKIKMEARDNFTGENVSVDLKSLDIDLPNDPQFESKQGRVVE